MKKHDKIIKHIKIAYFKTEQSLYINYLRLKSLISRKEIVHFLHIGKTGGTAFIEALNNIGLLKKAPRKIMYAETNSYIICLHNHSFSLKDVPIGEKVFFFVRDPIQRFISGFYGRKRQDRPRYNIPWSNWEKEAFNRFNTPNDLAISLDSENQETRESALKAMRSIQHVSTFLSGWTGSITYLKSRENDIIFIGFQENLDSDLRELGKIFNLTDNFKLPKDNVKKHKTPHYYSKEMNEQAIKTLKSWYENDYKIFELCQSIASKKRIN